MVEPGDSPGQETGWAPSAASIAACGIGGVVVALLIVFFVTDPPGRVLAGVAGTGLILFAGGSWRARPRLAMIPDGLVVRGWWQTQVLKREQLRLVRITEFRRVGRKVRLLEIDTVAGQLLVFSRWDLGTEPLAVLDVLTAEGYAGSQTG